MATPKQTRDVLDWMHEEVKKQMHSHPHGTCDACDAKRARKRRRKS